MFTETLVIKIRFRMELVHNKKHSNTFVSSWFYKLGSVAGPVIQANGRL